MENSNMKECKHCGAEIDKNAKACPQCGRKTKKPLYKRIWFWLLIPLVLFIALMVIAEICVPTYDVDNKQITLDLNNIGVCDGVYSGEMDDEIPQGSGLFVCQDSNGNEWSYDGTWKDGQMSGAGTYTYSDGHTVYEGEIQDNIKSGTGTLSFDGVKWIEGTFENDVLIKGEQYNHKGEVVYSGPFKDGQPSDLHAIKEYAKLIPYEDMERNPDDYKDDIVVLSGQVMQVLEGEGDEPTSISIAVDGNSENMVLANYSRKEGEKRILEGDNITIYGNYYNVVSYKDILSLQHTVPGITIYYYE